MPEHIEGKLDAKGLKFALVVSRFNDFVTRRLMEGALDAINRCGGAEDDVSISDKLLEAARRIAMSRRVKFPRELRIYVCRGCKRILIPGRTARVRIKRKDKSFLVITCLRCGHVYRRSIKD